MTDFKNDFIYDPTLKLEQFNTVIVNVENMKRFILQTKDKNYVLDFQKLLEDYGVEVKEQ